MLCKPGQKVGSWVAEVQSGNGSGRTMLCRNDEARIKGTRVFTNRQRFSHIYVFVSL